MHRRNRIPERAAVPLRGPRLTIIEAAPYDRARTTMRRFVMCPACLAEYRDPFNRLFHAQPIACPACGPRLTLSTMDGCPIDASDAIAAAAAVIAGSGIVALKGLGGFPLACDATNGAAVLELRRRKRRLDKPLAIMMPDLATIGRHCVLSDVEAALLLSPEAPIMVLEAGIRLLPEAVAPGLSSLGVMLPHTPLHHPLMQALGRPTVMSSSPCVGTTPGRMPQSSASRLPSGLAPLPWTQRLAPSGWWTCSSVSSCHGSVERPLSRAVERQ